jgi:hypothetical protein
LAGDRRAAGAVGGHISSAAPPLFCLACELDHIGVVYATLLVLYRTFPPVRKGMPPRQSRRAIIFRSAALFILNPATFHCDNGVDSLWSPALSSKRSQSLKPEAAMGTSTKKPLSLQYAELLRLRKAVQEASAAESRKATKRKRH